MEKLLKNHFSAADLKTIKARLVEVDYPPGSELIKPGDNSKRQMSYLASGYVKITYPDPEYRMPVVVAVLGPGAVFGEEMVLLDEPSQCRVQSISAVRLFLLQRDQFERLKKHHTQVANRMLSYLLTLNLKRLGSCRERLVAVL